MTHNTKNEMKLCTRIDGCTCPGVHRTENMTHTTREVEEVQVSEVFPFTKEGKTIHQLTVDGQQWISLESIHHQLQKARHDWLQELTKELKSWGGIGWSPDDYAHEIEELVSRYQAELDQDNK